MAPYQDFNKTMFELCCFFVRQAVFPFKPKDNTGLILSEQKDGYMAGMNR